VGPSELERSDSKSITSPTYKTNNLSLVAPLLAVWNFLQPYIQPPRDTRNKAVGEGGFQVPLP